MKMGIEGRPTASWWFLPCLMIEHIDSAKNLVSKCIPTRRMCLCDMTVDDTDIFYFPLGFTNESGFHDVLLV